MIAIMRMALNAKTLIILSALKSIAWYEHFGSSEEADAACCQSREAAPA
jgi:hypothetical protein